MNDMCTTIKNLPVVKSHLLVGVLLCLIGAVCEPNFFILPKVGEISFRAVAHPIGVLLGVVFEVINIMCWYRLVDLFVDHAATKINDTQRTIGIVGYNVVLLVAIKLGILAAFLTILLVVVPELIVSALLSFVLCLIFGSIFVAFPLRLSN